VERQAVARPLSRRGRRHARELGRGVASVPPPAVGRRLRRLGTWRPGQCGYHALYGHVEIVVDGASSRACSDYCGAIRKSCGAPGVYVPVGGGGPGGGGAGGCGLGTDARLHCDNRSGAPLHEEPSNLSAVVNTLRTTHSWFDCWTSGARHAGGNATWYHTVGDDNRDDGFVAGVDVSTPDALDANPGAAGLAKCGR
jgi:hypothetical protein